MTSTFSLNKKKIIINNNVGTVCTKRIYINILQLITRKQGAFTSNTKSHFLESPHIYYTYSLLTPKFEDIDNKNYTAGRYVSLV